MARSEALGSDIAALRARVGDFEADAATLARDNAQALAALRERLSSAEAARDASRVDLSAAEARAQAMREQVCRYLSAATFSVFFFLLATLSFSSCSSHRVP